MYWGAVFFTIRRGVLEKSFFQINFIGVKLNQEMKHVKKFGVILLTNKMKSEAKIELSLFISLFSRKREIEVWKKKSVSEQNFLFLCGILNQFFLILLLGIQL